MKLLPSFIFLLLVWSMKFSHHHCTVLPYIVQRRKQKYCWNTIRESNNFKRKQWTIVSQKSSDCCPEVFLISPKIYGRAHCKFSQIDCMLNWREELSITAHNEASSDKHYWDSREIFFLFSLSSMLRNTWSWKLDLNWLVPDLREHTPEVFICLNHTLTTIIAGVNLVV